MTPNEALEDAKLQFNPLYFNETPNLTALLKRALGVYQDKAGVMKTVKTADLETSVPIPADMLTCVFANDKNNRYHEVFQGDDTLYVEPDLDSVLPYTFHYFVNLRDYGLDTALPNGIVGTLIEYLVALIDVHNTERARAVALATGRQMELPTNDELNNRKLTVEAYMEDNKAIIPMLSVY